MNIISRPGKSDYTDRTDLKIKQLLTLFLNEGRVTGIITLKDTMSYVRYHGNIGTLHAKSIGMFHLSLFSSSVIIYIQVLIFCRILLI